MDDEKFREYMNRYNNRSEYSQREKNDSQFRPESFEERHVPAKARSKNGLYKKKGLTVKQIDSKINSLNRKVNFSNYQGLDKVKFALDYLLKKNMDVLDNLDIAEDQKENLENITRNLAEKLENLSENREYLDHSSSHYVMESCEHERDYREACEKVKKYEQELKEHKKMLMQVDRFSLQYFDVFKNYQKARSLYFEAFKQKSVSYEKRNSCMRSVEKIHSLSQFNNSVEFDIEHMVIQGEELTGEATFYHKIMHTIIDAVKDSTTTEDYHEKVAKCLEHYDKFNKDLKSNYQKRIMPKMNFED